MRVPASPARPTACVDDHAAGVRLSFTRPFATLTARRPEDVPGLLDQAQAATDAGAWAVGFLSYEAASGLDPALLTGPADARLPLGYFALFDRAPTSRALPGSAEPGGDHLVLAPWAWDWDADRHAANVGAVRAAIAAGTAYQVNLTTRLRSRLLAGDPLELYRRLTAAQGGGLGVYLDTGDSVVACASPELFLRWSGDTVTVRPMKGTAPRGRWPAEDRARADALGSSEKERAENIMVVDLLRNDLGRIASPGSVVVRDLLRTEAYRTVWQLTSTITASVPGAGLAQVMGALFPSGSVTGAPKAAAMRLIRDLEDAPRGVYCGAVGYLAPPGGGDRAVFSVAIRTAVLHRDDAGLVYGVGGGITWPSQADAEWAELHAKAAILRPPTAAPTLLETMRHDPTTGITNLGGHLARLTGSGPLVGVAVDEAAVRSALDRAVAGLPGPPGPRPTGPSRVRLTVGAGGVEVTTRPLPPDGPGPVRLALDDVPVDPEDPALYVKTTRRERYDAARARHPLADDVVLVNTRGALTETAIATLAVCRDGCWYTPPVGDGCLPGVERERLVGTGTLVERTLHPADLLDADALAVISSLRGWRAAVLLAPGA